jgi:hypothetical protein
MPRIKWLDQLTVLAGLFIARRVQYATRARAELCLCQDLLGLIRAQPLSLAIG